MKHVLNLIFVLFLSSCSYFTTYHRPKVPVNNRWTVSDRNMRPGNRSTLPYLAWWHTFHDPTLNKLIRQGMIQNNSLNMSRSSIEAAQGELLKVKLQWIPDIDGLFGYSRNPDKGFPGFLVLFVPSYVINIFSQIKEQKKAKYELANIKAEDDALKLTIISQIAGSYFTYQAEVERKTLYQRLEQDLKQLANISLKVYKDGIIADIEPNQLLSEVDVVQGELEVVDNNIIASRDAIRYLINDNPGPLRTTKQFNDLNTHQIIPNSLPITVLENRPDMQMAETRLKAATEGIGLAASHLLPDITLDLFYGPISQFSRYTTPRHLIKFNDQLLDVPGLRLSVLGQIAKAKGLNKEAYFHYIDTLLTALRDTTDAISANDRLTAKLKQTETAQQHLAKVYFLNQKLTDAGIQNYFDTLKTKIALDKIRIAVNEDKLKQLLTTVRLYQELAGGYKSVPNPKPEMTL